MKLYAGERRKDGSVKVIVWDDVSFGMKYARYTRLDARPELVDEIADRGERFDWGRPGAGAAALAAAILADCVGEHEARLHYRAFVQGVVQRFGPERWKISEQDVTDALERLSGSRRAAPTSVEVAEREHPQLAALAAWLAGGHGSPGHRHVARAG